MCQRGSCVATLIRANVPSPHETDIDRATGALLIGLEFHPIREDEVFLHDLADLFQAVNAVMTGLSFVNHDPHRAFFGPGATASPCRSIEMPSAAAS